MGMAMSIAGSPTECGGRTEDQSQVNRLKLRHLLAGVGSWALGGEDSRQAPSAGTEWTQTETSPPTSTKVLTTPVMTAIMVIELCQRLSLRLSSAGYRS